MSNISALPTNAKEARRARRAIGAMFFVAFGAVWLVLGASRLSSSPVAADAGIAVITLLFLSLTLRIRKQALLRAGPLPEPTANDRRSDKWFHVVNAGQWALIVIVSNVLANVGLGNWTIPAVMFIIGAHFLPLARIFAVPSHFVTGTALMLLACVYPFVAAAGPMSGTGPVFAGLLLWASAGYALRPAGVDQPRAPFEDAA